MGRKKKSFQEEVEENELESKEILEPASSGKESADSCEPQAQALDEKNEKAGHDYAQHAKFAKFKRGE